MYEVNVLAPLALTQLALPRLGAEARIVNVTSDAAFEPYPSWGGYGSAKAALAQISAVLAAEHPAIRVYAVDPGDMRTQMQQDAYPGEDISELPPPEASVPGLLALLEGAPAERLLPRRATSSRWRRERADLRATRAASKRAAARPRLADDVRLLVANRADGSIVHSRFRDLPHFLAPGDLLVLNTSATLPAALARRSRGRNRARAAALHACAGVGSRTAAGSSSCAAATLRSPEPTSATS